MMNLKASSNLPDVKGGRDTCLGDGFWGLILNHIEALGRPGAEHGS